MPLPIHVPNALRFGCERFARASATALRTTTIQGALPLSCATASLEPKAATLTGVVRSIAAFVAAEAAPTERAVAGYVHCRSG
ncbi:hypothetical protein, partial [Xanthomonas graminis]|uniref:hypothetical protein n=1 Tax=Xanthomonas graminis TaxID=3390026 RepID=UPI001E43752E